MLIWAAPLLVAIKKAFPQAFKIKLKNYRQSDIALKNYLASLGCDLVALAYHALRHGRCEDKNGENHEMDCAV